MTQQKPTSRRDQLLTQMEKRAATGRGASRPGTPRVPKVQINRSEGTSRRARSASSSGDKRTVDEALFFAIVDEHHPEVISGKRGPDDSMVRQLKNEINASGITRRDLYGFIGPETDPRALFRNENQAYNLEYGLRGRPTITLECVNRWLAVLGKELVTVFQPQENGWFDTLLSLREAMQEMLDAGAIDSSKIDTDALAEMLARSKPDDNGF